METRDRNLLLMKLHYFLFLGSLGPILPSVFVMGKQMRISQMVLGIVNFVLTLLIMLGKPLVGYLSDLFHRQRKIVFLSMLIILMIAFSLLNWIPNNCHTKCGHVRPKTTTAHPNSTSTTTEFTNIPPDSMEDMIPEPGDGMDRPPTDMELLATYSDDMPIDNTLISKPLLKPEVNTLMENMKSQLGNPLEKTSTAPGNTNNHEITTLRMNIPNVNLTILTDNTTIGGTSNTTIGGTNNKIGGSNNTTLGETNNATIDSGNFTTPYKCIIVCNDDYLYLSSRFWYYVACMCIGLMAFNVISSTSDAICFDILGEGNEVHYGMQRVYGTIGFGTTALISGWAIDTFSGESDLKDYTPAFCIFVIFLAADVICCFYIKLPRIPVSRAILEDVSSILKEPYVKSFIFFAFMAGFCEGFLILSLFWYMEDLAIANGSFGNIKLIQGITVACETLLGEVVFFSYSDKIIELMGYGHCMTFCFFCYFIRLTSLGLITNPWLIIPVEMLTQGPTYALSYTTIVAYAAAIAPSGTSATMQGVMAGVNDGIGYSVSSFIGGIFYELVGGSYLFLSYGFAAFMCMVVHFFVYRRAVQKLEFEEKQQDIEYSKDLFEMRITTPR
uniref:Major facilitator superfamily domain-containing protein 6 n=1 Tax=Cacopsylla melanoneura TaxID=428564 RepID=A0A8D8X0H2_9HEMI